MYCIPCSSNIHSTFLDASPAWKHKFRLRAQIRYVTTQYQIGRCYVNLQLFGRYILAYMHVMNTAQERMFPSTHDRWFDAAGRVEISNLIIPGDGKIDARAIDLDTIAEWSRRLSLTRRTARGIFRRHPRDPYSAASLYRYCTSAPRYCNNTAIL